MVHRQRRDAGLEPAGRAEQVPGHRLGRRDRELLRMIPERTLDGERLDLVAVLRGRAVGVHVVDLRRLDAARGSSRRA